MFRKKKEVVEYTLFETHKNCFSDVCKLLGFSFIVNGETIVEQNNNVGFKLLEKKIDLILSHLNLEYIPETEKKEPAKLVEKKNILGGIDSIEMFDSMLPLCEINSIYKSKQPKKKREQPKKKREQPKKKREQPKKKK